MSLARHSNGAGLGEFEHSKDTQCVLGIGRQKGTLSPGEHHEILREWRVGVLALTM